jgi:hypothetical protein
MDGSLTKIILDAEIKKVTQSMDAVIENKPEWLEQIGKLNFILKDLEHIERHLNYLIKKYEKIT